MSCDQCRGHALYRPCPCCSEDVHPWCRECDTELNGEGRCSKCDYDETLEQCEECDRLLNANGRCDWCGDTDDEYGGDEAGDTA